MPIPGNLLSANAESIETDASAWVAVVNAHSLAKTNGGTDGPSSMQWRTTAAGDTQVGLVTRVPVTAGAEYWSCASIFPPGAGSQSRVEIRWHNAGGTLISTTQGALITATGGWHQVTALGTAPALATTANVILRATGTGVGQYWFTDRIFLGLTPTVQTGNLLNFNTETMEVSTAGWFASANVALGISNSAFTWYQSLSMKAVASGDMLTTSALSQAPTVVADTEYVAHTMVSPAVAALTFRIQIHWRDAGGTDISVSSADWTPPSGQWTRVSVVAVAPPGAVLARVAFAPTATAAGQEWLVDRVVLAPTSAVSTAGNLLPYNVSSMEQDISGWTITAGTATQSRTQVFNGGYSLRAEADGTADMQISTTVPVAGITPGFGHQFTPPIYRGAGVTRAYATQLEWLSATDEVLRTRWQIWGGVSEAWVLGSLGDLAPEGAVSVRLSVVVPGATAGEVWYLDRVHLGLGGLTCHAVEAPGGGAALTVRGLTTGGPTWIWSLTRVVAGEQPRPVRGWDGDLSSKPTTSDTYVITDYEAPLGVPVSWRIWTQTPTLTASLTYLSVEVTLDAPELAVWLTDPGSPARAAQVTVGTPMPAWARSARQNTSHVRQRAMPVVISDVRVGRTGQLSLVTADTSERDALWWILEAGGPLLLRWPPRFGERDMYVSVGEVSETRVTDFAEHADRTWTLALTEIDRPPGGITGSADRTWQTVRDSGATWAEALAGSMTWLDVYTGGS